MIPVPVLYFIIGIVNIIILLVSISTITLMWPFLAIVIAGAFGIGAYYAITTINTKSK